ncbi:tRNA (adenine(22)-N(1))-methyltransferase [Miniphocaeibacter massiliensis]|uniref:tRNA (adenine(22)-N(1))-methyltransferase n=1 Tax=Miniphocaeibacter massiliensis TaxID=2041841 RepID=UPI000C08151B|nr:class I SAM-dependent methyltransferase [Miniphocaeibacter massiliensis]
MNQERLLKIANLIEQNSIVADIGTDHGLIPIFLSENNIAKKIIASDISGKSLSKLVDKIYNNPYMSNIETRVSDGLNEYKLFEADTIIVSGMGGILITKILNDNLEIAKSANNLVLQANNGLYELRKFLHENGFAIIDEDDVIENKKYYQIIKTKVGLEKYEKKEEYYFGRVLIKKKSKNLELYIDKLINDNKKLMKELNILGNKSIKDRITDIKKENLFYENVRKNLEN